MTSPPPRQRLPFEPKQTKKKLKAPPGQPEAPPFSQRSQADLQAIPDAVSKRMVKRMALFSGIPTGLGMMSFVIFYWIVSHDWLEIPTYFVFAISLGLFGLGVLGLSYGIFSTSWDEGTSGHWWGWQEFKLNFGRTVKAWRSERNAIKRRP